MEKVLEVLANLVISTIQATEYAGIAFLMALESANIPIPSEIIMPFSGFLAFREELSFFWIVFWGATGNLLGSLASYYLGLWGGRPFLERYGKFLFIHSSDLEKADRFFVKYGSLAVFIAKLLPIARTFISLPAGIAKMSLGKFVGYTLAGSFLWSWFLAYVGWKAGENWQFLEPWFRRFDWAIALVLAFGVLWWIRRHFKKP